MIRTSAGPRIPARITAAAAAGLVGAVALAGCAAPAETSEAETDTQASAPADTGTGSSSGEYVDGEYTAEGSYATPETVETISVTVELEGGIITAVSVEGDPQRAESERYQGEFIGGISDEVVGESIDDISVSRVAGSSLTSGGFNEAIEAIKAEAAA